MCFEFGSVKRMPLNCVWLLQLSDLRLADNEVHLWRAWLEQPTICLRLLYRLLSVDERHRVGRFRFDLDRNRFVARRGLLRVILGRYLDLKPASIRFGYGPNGKPFLEDACNRDELTFNLSHSKELAIYAITRKRRIGVDVERLRPITESDRIVADLYAFTARRPDQPAEPFLNWWTRYEAYLKASGSGLSRRIDSTEDSMLEGRVSRSSVTKSASEETVEWSLQTLMPAPGYAAALVVEATDWHLVCLELPNDWEKGSQGFQSSQQTVAHESFCKGMVFPINRTLRPARWQEFL